MGLDNRAARLLLPLLAEPVLELAVEFLVVLVRHARVVLVDLLRGIVVGDGVQHAAQELLVHRLADERLVVLGRLLDLEHPVVRAVEVRLAS